MVEDHGGSGVEGWQVVVAFVVLMALAIYLYIQHKKAPVVHPLLPVSNTVSPTSAVTPLRF